MTNKLLLNWSGGMNSTASPLLLKDNEAEFILNYQLDAVGALTKRGGYEIWGNRAVAQNYFINGLYWFEDASAGAIRFIMVADNSAQTQGVIYRYNFGTLVWDSVKTNDTASRATRFTAFVDYIFRTNGADVVATSADGATWGTTNAPATITPKFCATFQDRVYVANGGASNNSRFWFSSLPSGGAITWTTASDFVDVNPDDGDVITALENNGSNLLIFKKRALYRWTFGQVEPDRLIGVGTYSQESVRTNFDLGVTFFANTHGVYAYTTGRPRLISRKIQKYIDAVSDWTAICGGVDRDHYYLSVGNLTVDGRTLTNATLVYNIPLDAWTIFTTATRIKIFAEGASGLDGTDQLFIGGNDYRVSRFLNTNFPNDNVSGTLTPINCEVTSKEVLISYPNKSTIDYVDIFAQKRGGANAFIDLDRANAFEPIGALTERVSTLRPPRRECNSVRIRITDNTQPVEISGTAATSVLEGFNLEYTTSEKRNESKPKIRERNTY